MAGATKDTRATELAARLDIRDAREDDRDALTAADAHPPD
jgi:hypothetical protein